VVLSHGTGVRIPVPVLTFLDQWRHGLRVKAAGFAASDPAAAAETLPLPAPEQIRRVNSAEKADLSVFLRSGVTDLLAIVDALADAIESRTSGVPPFPATPAIMELGCGLGRLLRHAPNPTLARVIATDVNAASLEWCRTNLPGIAYHLHGPLPPIASLPAASVDIIYAHSVFTHIPLERQLAWLREMERVLRPGGWLAATFLGRAQQEALLDAEQRARLAADGAIQIDPQRADGSSGEPIAYGAVCQTGAHQEMMVGTVFDLCVRLERGDRQDVLVVRRR
jgi:SAM-dependent methyltransferase